eukprot:2002120-Pyramimonas_sp.AAC.1
MPPGTAGRYGARRLQTAHWPVAGPVPQSELQPAARGALQPSEGEVPEPNGVALLPAVQSQ